MTVMLVACLMAGSLPAQTAVRYTASIAVAEAELRSGPSTDSKLYATNRLRQGDTVTVVEERTDGWLGVRPPAGSFSWVNAKHLQQVTPTLPNWVVIAPPGTRVSALVGSSSDTTVRPSVESAVLQRGTQLRAVGALVGNDDQKWLPIEPPETEKRYLRREAIGGASLTSAPALAAVPAMGAAAMAVGANTNPLARWNEAVSAELSGNWTESIRLYSLIAQDFGDTQPNMATQASNRAMVLREALRYPGTRVGPPERPCLNALPAPSFNSGGGVQLAQPLMPSGTPVPGQLMSSNGFSGGVLRRSGRSVDNRRAYILERDNRIVGYVVPVPSLNLEPFLNQPVTLTGTTEYRGEVRANVLHANTATLGR